MAEQRPPREPGIPDAARAVLSRVRAAARAAAGTPGMPGTPGGGRGPAPGRPTATRRRVGGFSGPGPDERDPVPMARAWSSLVAAQGWDQPLDVARLLGMWPDIVGPANAEHATPESFDVQTGILQVRTSSTAWCEQLRLMMPALRASIDATVGPGVVREIRIAGPTPPRSRGRLRVKGRGPRDTYG